MIARWAMLLACVAGLCVVPASADVLLLKDGRIVDGPKMEQKEGHVVISFENGDVAVKDEMIRTALIEGGPEYVPVTDEEKAQFEKGRVPFGDKWVKPGKRAKLIEKALEEQRAEIADAMAHSTWGNKYEEQTKNFRWHFTIPRHVWERYGASLEAYYTIFCKDWRIKRDKRKPKLLINFFSSRAEFNRTSGAGGGALAYFMFLGDYDLCVFYERLDPDNTEMVLFHEAGHYLHKLVNPNFDYPHWPSEGMAEYYGGALWDPVKKKLSVGLILEGRLTEVKSDISMDKYIPLKDVVKIEAYTDYTWGWTLCHFLMSDKRYRKGFQKYFTGIANAKGVKRTVGAFSLRTVTPEESLRYFMECLKVKSDEALEKLEKEWYEYIKNDLQVTSTGGLEKAASSAVRSGKRIRAERLFKEAHDAGGMSANGLHQYASLVQHKDRALAKRLWEEAIAEDPLVGTYYYRLAGLVRGSDEAEGKRLKGLAKELDPEVDVWGFDDDEEE